MCPASSTIQYPSPDRVDSMSTAWADPRLPAGCPSGRAIPKGNTDPSAPSIQYPGRTRVSPRTTVGGGGGGAAALAVMRLQPATPGFPTLSVPWTQTEYTPAPLKLNVALTASAGCPKAASEA